MCPKRRQIVSNVIALEDISQVTCCETPHSHAPHGIITGMALSIAKVKRKEMRKGKGVFLFFHVPVVKQECQ